MTKKMLWRTFLIALLAAVIVLAAGIGVISFQASNTQKRELEVDANLIAQLWDGDVASLETLRPHADLRITVINISDGEVIYDNTAEVDEEHLTRPEVQAALNGQPQAFVRWSETMDCTMYYYAVRYGEEQVLRVAVRQSAVTDYVLSLLPFTVLALGLALLISYLVANRSSRAVTQPVKDIQLSLRSLNQGSYVPLRCDSSNPELYAVMTETDELFSKVNENLKKLQDSRARLSFVLDNVSQSIVAFDRDGTVTLINRAAMSLFGVNSSALGQNLLYLIEDNKLSRKISQVLDGGGDQHFEYELRDHPLNVDLIDVAKYEADVKMIMILTDLSAEKLAIRQRSDFFANAGHELKTPLTSLQGMSELLLEKEPADSPNRKYVERIHKETVRLNDLILDMLRLSSLEQASADEAVQAVQLSAVFQDISAEFAGQMEQKGITYTQTGEGKIFADPKKIYTCCENLFSNAVRYNKQGGHVEVVIEDFPQSVRFSVRDTGIGIEQKHIPRLCERFYRVDKSRSKNTGGTGLGLAIVKHVCQIYDAKLTIVSAPDEGTTVSVTFKK